MQFKAINYLTVLALCIGFYSYAANEAQNMQRAQATTPIEDLEKKENTKEEKLNVIDEYVIEGNCFGAKIEHEDGFIEYVASRFETEENKEGRFDSSESARASLVIDDRGIPINWGFSCNPNNAAKYPVRLIKDEAGDYIRYRMECGDRGDLTRGQAIFVFDKKTNQMVHVQSDIREIPQTEKANTTKKGNNIINKTIETAKEILIEAKNIANRFGEQKPVRQLQCSSSNYDNSLFTLQDGFSLDLDRKLDQRTFMYAVLRPGVSKDTTERAVVFSNYGLFIKNAERFSLAEQKLTEEENQRRRGGSAQ